METAGSMLMWSYQVHHPSEWVFRQKWERTSGRTLLWMTSLSLGNVLLEVQSCSFAFDSKLFPNWKLGLPFCFCVCSGPVTPIPRTCHMEHFQCLYLFECIPLSWHCDGEVDCLDHSDEEMCASVVPGTRPPQTGCETGEYRCMDRCIPALLHCDTVVDCPNGEDEYGCRKTQAQTCLRTAL